MPVVRQKKLLITRTCRLQPIQLNQRLRLKKFRISGLRMVRVSLPKMVKLVRRKLPAARFVMARGNAKILLHRRSRSRTDPHR